MFFVNGQLQKDFLLGGVAGRGGGYCKLDNLLFVFISENSEVGSKFMGRDDWEAEIKRVGCDKTWRVTDVNVKFYNSTK